MAGFGETNKLNKTKKFDSYQKYDDNKILNKAGRSEHRAYWLAGYR